MFGFRPIPAKQVIYIQIPPAAAAGMAAGTKGEKGLDKPYPCGSKSSVLDADDDGYHRKQDPIDHAGVSDSSHPTSLLNPGLRCPC